MVIASHLLGRLGKSSGGDRYVCSGCGYEYVPELGDEDGEIAPGTLFEQLPAEWVCPCLLYTSCKQKNTDHRRYKRNIIEKE